MNILVQETIVEVLHALQNFPHHIMYDVIYNIQEFFFFLPSNEAEDILVYVINYIMQFFMSIMKPIITVAQTCQK